MKEYQTYKLEKKEENVLSKLETYLSILFSLPRIQKIISKYSTTVRQLRRPQIVISKTCGASIAGQTWYYNHNDSIIEISSWVLYDIIESQRVLRHEFAHVLKSYCKYEGGVHGRGYTRALKIVSNRKWRTDRHWRNSAEIEKVRIKIHPRIRVEFE